jgi:hypothetical protein
MDTLDIVSMTPPTGSSMIDGNWVKVTFHYKLESAAKGKIMVLTLGAPGNPPHVSENVPIFVNKGEGTVTAPFSVKCDPKYPPQIKISNMRYELFEINANGAIVRTLVDKFVDKYRHIDYKFDCPKVPFKKPF